MLEYQLMNSLALALKSDLPSEVAYDIKNRIKTFLEHRIKELEDEYEQASKHEQECLQNDDRFSRETEEAMKEVTYAISQLNTARELLALLPPDRVVRRVSTSGVYYDLLP